MKSYQVTISLLGDFDCEVEANSELEAKDIAAERFKEDISITGVDPYAYDFSATEVKS